MAGRSGVDKLARAPSLDLHEDPLRPLQSENQSVSVSTPSGFAAAAVVGQGRD
jgi:hypothetical protein